MALELTISNYPHPDGSETICAKFSPYATIQYLKEAILDKIASAIAERYVADHYVDIIAKLDQNAIANLAVADAGKKIAAEIRTHPVVFREQGDTKITKKYSIF